jgi:elongation factor Ts
MTEQKITAALIKELRERTGVGMTKCKAALEESKSDIELAITNLRKSGMASAEKKEGRATKEGIIASAENDHGVTLIEINAETDFVVKNETFQEFAKNIAEEVANTKPASLEAFLAQKYSKEQDLSIDEFRATIVQKIGENIQIKRFEIIEKGPEASVGIYLHMGGKIASLVKLQGANDKAALAKDIAMHIAAENPEFLDVNDITSEVKLREEEIAREQVKNKPENIIEKIIEGKLKAFYDQACLNRQKFVKNPDVTIAQLVAQNGENLKIEMFKRWAVGE